MGNLFASFRLFFSAASLRRWILSHPLHARMQHHLFIWVSVVACLCLIGLWQIAFSPKTPLSSAHNAENLPQQKIISTPESAEANTVLDLFSPPEGSPKDPISQRHASIENTLLITFLLTHCKVISVSEYGETFHALVLYGAGGSTTPSAIAQSHQIAQEKAKSAAARYTMLYGRLPCDRTKLEPQAERLKAWRKLILDQQKR
jgi:hypothetical protein